VLTATPPSRREVLARLNSAQKSNRGAAGYSRWVNRPLGRQIAASAYRAGLTPNQVSTISAVFTFGGIVAIAAVRSSWLLGVLVSLALVLGYAFDSADGQVARLRGGGSPAGEWLDHVLDAVKVSALHVAVAIAWFRFFHFEHARTLLIPLVFTVVSAVFYFAITLSDMLRRIADAKSGGAGVATASVNPDERAGVLRSLVVLPNDYGLLCLSFLLFGAHRFFPVLYTLFLLANIVFLLVGCARWFVEMGTLKTR
jgi:phosphatidylglycerophosphate synthase